MKKLLLVQLFTIFCVNLIAQITPFERDPNKNTTATYAETIAYYQQLVILHQLKIFTKIIN